MSKETQSYWWSEMGIWGSNAVETFEFGPEHHTDIHEAFEYVSDWRVGEFIAYLQARPHEFLLSKNSHPNVPSCATCEDFAEQFEEAR
jgi:hypothetical protein